MKKIWNNFLTGLLVIFPAVVTFLILDLLFGWVFAGIINPMARAVIAIIPWAPRGIGSTLVHMLVAVAFVLIVAIIGWATRLLLIQRLIKMGEQLLRSVPMVGKVYGTIREILDTIGGEKRGVFKRVVLVEWPRPGIYAVGFVTTEGSSEIQQKTNLPVVSVFVPTTPNPTSGYLLLVSPESMKALEMTVEEGMRFVISGGVVIPPPRSSAAGRSGNGPANAGNQVVG